MPYAVTEPAPPEDATVCRLYGRVSDVAGDPVAFSALTFELVDAAFYAGVSAQSIVTRPKRAVTDRNGYFQIDLPRGVHLYLSSPWTRDPVPFTVPDEAVLPLVDAAWPRPTRIEWFWANDCHPEPIAQNPVGFVEVPAGEDLFVILGVVWSNGAIEPLSSPHFEATGFSLSEAYGQDTVRLRLYDGVSATLRSTEEQFTQTPGGLWLRSGYTGTNNPVFFPEAAYALRDPDTLTFVPDPAP